MTRTFVHILVQTFNSCFGLRILRLSLTSCASYLTDTSYRVLRTNFHNTLAATPNILSASFTLIESTPDSSAVNNTDIFLEDHAHYDMQR